MVFLAPPDQVKARRGYAILIYGDLKHPSPHTTNRAVIFTSVVSSIDRVAAIYSQTCVRLRAIAIACDFFPVFSKKIAKKNLPLI